MQTVLGEPQQLEAREWDGARPKKASRSSRLWGWQDKQAAVLSRPREFYRGELAKLNCTGWTIWGPAGAKLTYQVCEGNGEPEQLEVLLEKSLWQQSEQRARQAGCGEECWNHSYTEAAFLYRLCPVWWPLPTRGCGALGMGPA